MVKIVTVLETQACRTCRRSGRSSEGGSCPTCDGTGNIQVEVVR